MYTINVDWLNQNALRNYPIIDGASRRSAAGLELPNGLVVDISMPVPIGSVEPGELFIQRVHGFAAGVVITLASTKRASTVLASATIFLQEHQLNASYPLVGSGALAGSVGRITIGSMAALSSAATMLYDFTSVPDNTKLVASVTRPLLRGLSGIVVRNANGTTSEVLGGSVVLEAGANVSFTVDPDTNTIQINANVAGASGDCGCDGTSEPVRPPIKTINGVPPDQNGNFTLAGKDCTVFQPISGGLQIQDSCTDPCCGCDQLTSVQQGLQAVENGYNTLQESAEQLRGRLDNLAHALANASLNPPNNSTQNSTIWWYLPAGAGSGSVVVGG